MANGFQQQGSDEVEGRGFAVVFALQCELLDSGKWAVFRQKEDQGVDKDAENSYRSAM